MTEAEWPACTETLPLLEFLSDKASERKLRLCACAWCRRIPGFLDSESDRLALELTERDVDGMANPDEFGELEADDYDIRWYRRDGWDAVWRSQEAAWSDAKLAVFLHDIFGNPFRPITVPNAHRTPTIVSLAQAAYDERHLPSGELDQHRLAVLADALEETGASGELVEHLRSAWPHVRGCWAVDLCLGLS